MLVLAVEEESRPSRVSLGGLLESHHQFLIVFIFFDEAEHVGFPIVEVRLGRASSPCAGSDLYDFVFAQDGVAFFGESLNDLVLAPRKAEVGIRDKLLKGGQFFKVDPVEYKLYNFDQSINQKRIILLGILLLQGRVSDAAEISQIHQFFMQD